MPQTVQFAVTGQDAIHCEACEQRITTALRRLVGVEDVQASHETQQVVVTFDPQQVDARAIRSKLEQTGFEAQPQGDSA